MKIDYRPQGIRHRENLRQGRQRQEPFVRYSGEKNAGKKKTATMDDRWKKARRGARVYGARGSSPSSANHSSRWVMVSSVSILCARTVLVPVVVVAVVVVVGLRGKNTAEPSTASSSSDCKPATGKGRRGITRDEPLPREISAPHPCGRSRGAGISS